MYAGQFRGVVLLASPGDLMAKVRLDNGTVDWFRTDLMVPEGEHDPVEPAPGVWLDRAGFLWLETEPGSGRVFCYDRPVRSRMTAAWPSRDVDDAEAEFGPFDRMVPQERRGEEPG